MMPSTPPEIEPEENARYVYSLTPTLLQDYQFWDALASLAMKASENPFEGGAPLNPFWKLAYQQLAFACDHLSAMLYRYSQSPEYGP